jgi:hypothetical protein
MPATMITGYARRRVVLQDSLEQSHDSRQIRTFQRRHVEQRRGGLSHGGGPDRQHERQLDDDPRSTNSSYAK